MGMFSNDTRVANTATPAFHTEPNVTQYGWTKSDAAYYNQLIQYVDEVRQIYQYVNEKVVYFDEVLSKLAGIEDVIDFMVQKAGEVAEDARDVRATAAYITQTKTQIDIMYRNMTADFAIFNSKYADFSTKYDAILVVAGQVHQDSVDAKEAYLATKDLYDDLKAGQVYRGTWDPQTNAYPDGGGTNSTWDVVLPRTVDSYDFDDKTWRGGDRLIYIEESGEHIQIETGSGVLSVNGKTGVVTLKYGDVDAAPEGFGLGTFGKALLATSCDDAMDSGFYSINSDTTETPYTKGPSGSTMISTKWGSGAGASQLFFNYTSDRVHFRRRQASAWNAWREIFHTGRLPSPADIGALSKRGDSLEGNLQVGDTGSNLIDKFHQLNLLRVIGTGEITIGNTESAKIYLDVEEGDDGVVVRDSNGEEHIVVHEGNFPTIEDQGGLKEEDAETTGGLLMRVGGPRDQAIDVALAGATGGAFVSEVAPADPFQGARWFDTNDGRTYIWYDDGDSAQWVEENPQSADVMDGSPRLIKLADEGILDVAPNIKNAINLTRGSSISFQDQEADTKFHNFAEGSGLEWSSGDLGENTLMFLTPNGDLATSGEVHANGGIVTDVVKFKGGSLNSPAVNIMEMKGAQYSFVTAKLGAHLCNNSYWDGTNWLKNDAAQPSMLLAVDSGKFDVFSSAASATSPKQLNPLSMDHSGNAVFKGEVKSGRNLISNDNYAGMELLVPGKHAAMMYVDKDGGNMHFAQSDGAGAELLPYANFHPTALTFYRPSNFLGLVQSTAGFRVNAAAPVMELHSPGVAAYAWYIQGNGTMTLGQTNGAGSVAKNIVVIDTTGNIVLPSATLFYDGSLTGTIWGGPLSTWCRQNFAPISDRDLKRNIQPATKSALEDVSKIEFVSYDWDETNPLTKDKKSPKIGLTAQQMEEIDECYSRDINTFNEDGTVKDSVKSLDVTNMLSLALKAIQELEARVKELEEKVNG